ncbi:MAG: spermidine/putrescine ABC transporter ATP-binding protein [Candidatus Thermofonsia Clade 1 bacterium]|jgi:spermidine/putrescine transport system ATP-binding protein|uniref:Spermidine/putrescine import ATP-binding protein PotA n=1 Tax=Candidatus Thermofonsia Clade 1 bacterium TaxID=2364210 RepID=A0A2M8PGF2_9CHLR|nr:MAG: spermidine/putrescine ABC transporter ATP-binding protein [Candidatus Thermofonsia Clade 1 bacterium]RMF49584.1 MAG: ABC transporter ATP-binding protein [Chloroflexota bacterium]
MLYAVELVNLSKAYGNFRAVDDISLQIREGEFFSILGPSGCGKTTTLRLIAGFETPTSGRIYLQGREISGVPPFQRPVNTVFQNYALFPHMSVAENVAFGLEMQRVPRKEIERRVREALEMVRMADRANSRPHQLSGGQQQRVALARALVNRPAVLLLDEPLGALDLKLRKAMQLELKQIQQEVGITFIYVTHDQEEALTMSDRIAVMGHGKVLQCATPEEIYERPQSRYVADFIGETNFLEGRLISLNGTAQVQLEPELSIAAASSERALAQGAPVTIAIRPEKIALSAQDSDPSALRGIVREAVYIGTDMRYVVQLGQRTQVVVRVQNLGAERDQRFRRGDSVYVKWAAENARLLVD